ncbi:ribonuclease P protein component [Kaistella palustris]|uniref:ribonuclease P protein component n=1 Tax=Kaistella palustris TaxID=493376 RepID=UPI000426CE85|nr:ribonuclease P protein component [Kaistella palustris]
MNQKYPTREKLKQKKEIDFLFSKGKWQTVGNLRIISVDMTKKPSDEIQLDNQKVGVSVSKRYFKKAVDRNRIKRLLRETYRLNKDLFTAKFGTNSLSMLFWVSPEKPASYKAVEDYFKSLCDVRK